MTEEQPNKTAFEEIEESLRKLWLEKGKAPIIKAKHTELFVEPKVFIGGEVNPEIGKLIVKEYLSKISINEIAKGKVVITSDLIKIKGDDGKLLAEVRGKKIIDSMINKITNYLGKQLAEKTSKDGDPYVQKKETSAYAFGDIKGALIEFLMDMEKNDSKNLVRDAIVLLQKGNVTVRPSRP